MTLRDVVTALIAGRRLEQVPADFPSAQVRLSRAEDKLASAREIAEIDVEIALATPSAAEFQRMRRRRNKAEYDDIVIGRADLDADLAHADAIIEAVKFALSPPDRAGDST